MPVWLRDWCKAFRFSVVTTLLRRLRALTCSFLNSLRIKHQQGFCYVCCCAEGLKLPKDEPAHAPALATTGGNGNGVPGNNGSGGGGGGGGGGDNGHNAEGG